MKMNGALIKDLSKKSEVLTNILVPRSPVNSMKKRATNVHLHQLGHKFTNKKK